MSIVGVLYNRVPNYVNRLIILFCPGRRSGSVFFNIFKFLAWKCCYPRWPFLTQGSTEFNQKVWRIPIHSFSFFVPVLVLFLTSFFFNSDMNPLNTRKLRRATLKKRKADMVLTIGEPSGVQVMATPERKVVLSDTLEVAHSIILKHS